MYKIEVTYLVSKSTSQTRKMDNIKVGRKKKSDKAKETYERNGGFSQKHVRMMEAMVEKRSASTVSTTLAQKPKTK